MFMDKQLYKFKKLIEEAILEDGARGKESVIRSSSLINLIHDGVKQEFIEAGVCPDNIYPHIYETPLYNFFIKKYRTGLSDV